ncbi:MAG: UPF0149 family protein [Gammaproteobacteria bacterium]|nr:UPF0149 family protein [Gammaproteobacteria bacterium]
MTQVTWQQLTSSVKMAELGATASECHGIVCGLICGGISLEDSSWYGAFNDLMNDGLALPIDLKKVMQQAFDNARGEFLAEEYQVRLLLADDEQYLNERAKSLAQWTESFLTGLAIGNESGKEMSKDVKEALADLNQIAKIDSEIEDGEEAEQFLEEIIEYVRVSAILCFSELGQKPQRPETADADVKASKTEKKLH